MPQKDLPGVSHRFVDTRAPRMHIAEAGTGPLVLLLHGFPECWYSWRHQLTALAGAGYHAAAPDQRGYCRTGGPAAADQYTILHLTGDVIALLDALGEQQAVVDRNWELTAAWHHAPVTVPALFIAADRDLVISGARVTLPGLRGCAPRLRAPSCSPAAETGPSRSGRTTSATP